MAKPTFMGIWSKNLILGDSKNGCLIQSPASAFYISLVKQREKPFSCISEVSQQEKP